MVRHHRLRAAIAAAAALVACSAAAGLSAEASPGAAPGHRHMTRPPTPAGAPPMVPRATDLEKQTGLRVTIDRVKPIALTSGEPLELRGTVSNVGNIRWRDAQVYLDITYEPADTREELKVFAGTTEAFGTRIVAYGLFDEIGNVPPATRKGYRLTIPFKQLPISRAGGVYHVGISVLAETRRAGRDGDADARTDTMMPLLSDRADHGGDGLDPTGVVTFIPLSAPVRRFAGGNFLDDDLALSMAPGGQLRNLLDFIRAAPPNALEVVLDPALQAAASDMADGYTVQTLPEFSQQIPAHPGGGETAARQWLADLDVAKQRQDVLLMPWGSPEASSLGANALPGVVASAVRASEQFASDQRISTTVASWPYDGGSTRRGLAVSAIAGAPLRLVSEASLVNLRLTPGSSYPPSQVSVPTVIGRQTAMVTRSDVAGDRLTTTTSSGRLLQDIVAETTIRSLDDEPPATTVIALPFGWDPGQDIDPADLSRAYGWPTVKPQTASSAAQDTAVRYAGSMQLPTGIDGLHAEVIDAVRQLRKQGATLTELLTDQRRASVDFDQELAAAGSSLWRDEPLTRAATIEQAARRAARMNFSVSVTGPTFVALSSDSGRFPLTVTNGLDVSVTVSVVIHPENPAVSVDPVERLVLAPGQHRDIEATARADGSGLTGVRVHLTTTSHRRVGDPWDFDIRATQIGVAIWVVMGLVATVLFGAAGRRIYQRIKHGMLTPREEPMS